MRKQGNALVPFWDVSETKQNHFSGTVNKQFFNLGNFVLVSKINPQELLKGKTIRNITSGTKQFFFFFCFYFVAAFLSISLNGLRPSRTGRWHSYETMYAQRIVADFEAGTMPLSEGTKLGNFLCNILNCSPS